MLLCFAKLTQACAVPVVRSAIFLIRACRRRLSWESADDDPTLTLDSSVFVSEVRIRSGRELMALINHGSTSDEARQLAAAAAGCVGRGLHGDGEIKIASTIWWTIAAASVRALRPHMSSLFSCRLLPTCRWWRNDDVRTIFLFIAFFFLVSLLD